MRYGPTPNKAPPAAPAATHKRMLISLVVVTVLVVIALLLCKQPQPQVYGTLPREDIAEIARLVRSEMTRDVFRTFSFDSIWDLPSSVRRYLSDRLLSIHAGTNGTVEVMTGVIRGPLNGSGKTYELKRAPKGWEITSRGFWISRIEEAPKALRRTATTLAVSGVFGESSHKNKYEEV